ncbi:MAG: hypothetical protein F6K19_28165 [Cyanothece sp. SIO1E1]|nr:hypothetical protein [Cyanothece sp. SIO1E1]
MAISAHKNVSKTIIAAEMKALLSSLWIFFLLNLVFRDIHDFFRPGLLAVVSRKYFDTIANYEPV